METFHSVVHDKGMRNFMRESSQTRDDSVAARSGRWPRNLGWRRMTNEFS
jgi:hypothetical protein